VSDPHPTLPALDEPGDAELISAVRAGDLEAYGTLFERHVGAARRLARQLVSAGDVDDLVSEAFAKVLGVLQKGGGPDLAFRAYLLTSLRRLHVDKIRAGAKLTTTDDMTAYDPGVPFEDTAVAGFENETAAKAFAQLPERWQQVLWHTEVEGQKPAEIAPLLGMSPNSVSALAYRAREGLRQAFISMHAQDAVDDACATTRANLGAYIRNGLSRRDSAKVEAHLQECRPCTAIYLELTEVNSNLGALLAPLLLGAAGAGYLAAAATGTKAGILLFFGGVKNWLLHNPAGRATGVGAGVAAAAVAVAAVAAGGGNEPHKPDAAPPPASSSPAPAAQPPATTPQQSSPQPTSAPPVTTPQTTPEPTSPATTPPTTSNTPSPTQTPTPEQDPVISTPIPTVTVSPDAGSVVIDLTDGATDPNGDPLTVKSAEVAKPSHGTVKKGGKAGRVLTGGGGGGAGLSNGVVYLRKAPTTTVTYTPDEGWRGTDTITYVLTDGHGGTVSGSVDVRTPNAAPVAVADEFHVHTWWRGFLPDAPGVTLDVLSNDDAANGDRLVVTSLIDEHGKDRKSLTLSNGTVKLEDGEPVFYPKKRDPWSLMTESAAFKYAVSDRHGGRAVGKAKVVVGMLPNHAPRAADDSFTVDDEEEDSLPVIAGVGGRGRDTDSDGDDLRITYVSQIAADEGTVEIGPDKKTLLFTPAKGVSQSVALTYTITDGKATDSGTVHISVHRPSAHLFVQNTQGGGAGYTHINLSVDGIPEGRHADFKLIVDNFSGWHDAVNEDHLPNLCTRKPDGATLTLECDLSSSENNVSIQHWDVEDPASFHIDLSGTDFDISGITGP